MCDLLQKPIHKIFDYDKWVLFLLIFLLDFYRNTRPSLCNYHNLVYNPPSWNDHLTIFDRYFMNTPTTEHLTEPKFTILIYRKHCFARRGPGEVAERPQRGGHHRNQKSPHTYRGIVPLRPQSGPDMASDYPLKQMVDSNLGPLCPPPQKNLQFTD